MCACTPGAISKQIYPNAKVPVVRNDFKLLICRLNLTISFICSISNVTYEMGNKRSLNYHKPVLATMRIAYMLRDVRRQNSTVDLSIVVPLCDVPAAPANERFGCAARCAAQ